MGDPLSVAGTVLGLITGSAEMIKTLYTIGSVIKDAPQVANQAAGELAAIAMLLQKLQEYISGKAQASRQRLSLITVEHITATLTSCVVTYSELNQVLESLHVGKGMRAWDRGMWYIKKPKVDDIVVRLQNHKSSFNLMLNIMQCSSMGEAESSMDRLCDLVNNVLRSNQDLSARLRNMEESQRGLFGSNDSSDAAVGAGALADATQAVNMGAADPSAAVERIPPPSSPTMGSPILADDEPQRANVATSADRADSALAAKGPDLDDDEGIDARASTFEELLHRSRVYRHVVSDDSAFSVISEDRSTLALSICSSLTLGQVSNIALYAIPVYLNELSNPHCYKSGPGASGTIWAGEAEGVESDSQAVTQETSRSSASWSWRRLRRSKAAEPVAVELHVFGIPLRQSICYANVAISVSNEEGSVIFGYIPIVVAKCGVYLKQKGLKLPNIFELGSSPLKLNDLQNRFEKPSMYGKGLNWADPDMGYTPYDAANLMLRWLLMLPSPVIPDALYDGFRQALKAWEEAGDANNATQTIAAYRDLLKQLPPLNRQLLLYLCDMMNIFAQSSDVNFMTTARLATLFQRGILSNPEHELEAHERSLNQRVVVFLVENYDSLLNEVGVAPAKS